MVEERLSKLIDRIPHGLIKLPYLVFIVEEIADELKRSYMDVLRHEGVRRLRTTSVERTSFTLDRAEKLLNVVGSGVIRELILTSEGPNITVVLEVDSMNIIPYHKSLDELINVSPKLEFLSVFQENSSYVLHVKDIKFTNNAAFISNPIKPTLIRRFFSVVDVEVSE